MKRKSVAKMLGVRPALEESASATEPIAAANGAIKSSAEYLTASFTRRLLEHVHRAKKAALESKKEPVLK